MAVEMVGMQEREQSGQVKFQMEFNKWQEEEKPA